MNLGLLLLILAPIALVFLVVLALVLPRRIQAERRARTLLAQFPGAPQTSVYLPLRSSWAWTKQREIEGKIAEMKAEGWLFLRSREASPRRTIRSWGGGLNLEFIRAQKP